VTAFELALASGNRHVGRFGQGSCSTLERVSGAAPTTIPAHWVEPASHVAYPTWFPAYRRMREAEERPPARHRALGPDVDHYLWRHRGVPVAAAVEVVLEVRPDTPPRIRRLVAETLRAIRRGHPAGEAIRRVAQRFGLRDARARGCIRAWLEVERRVYTGEAMPAESASATGCSLGDWA
jgi:hypothetical protein